MAIINGTNRNDTLDGGFSDDTIRGFDGADNLNGSGGDDLILGGGDRDRLIGGNGSDTLDGGLFQDTLRGATGADVFRFTGKSDEDTIVDFRRAEGDKIDVSSYNLTGLGDVRVNVTRQTFGSIVRIDVDGDGTFENGETTIVVNNVSVIASDFIF